MNIRKPRAGLQGRTRELPHVAKVGLGLLALLPRALAGARLCVHIALFVLVRDAMTPVGLWRLEAGPPFWLRLADDARSCGAAGASRPR